MLGALARTEGGRPSRSSKRHEKYVEWGSCDDEMGGELQHADQVIGLLFIVADLRYIGRDMAEAGSVMLNAYDVRQLLHCEGDTGRHNRTLWFVTTPCSRDSL